MPMAKNGPTVCDAVARKLMSWLPRRRLLAAKDDVEAIAEGPAVLGQLPVERRHQAIARLAVGDARPDRIELEERVALEVHLRDHARGEGRPEDREVHVRRPPGIVVVAPRVRARANGDQAIATFAVGENATEA